MSLTPREIKKIRTIQKNNTEKISICYVEDKINDYNTISTVEKERLTKSKTVTFRQIEIINVESYKKYNQIGYLTLESLEHNCSRTCDACNCNIF